jgi:hypothetical protein
MKSTILLLSLLIGSSSAFQSFFNKGGNNNNAASALKKQAENDAIAIFDKTYPFGRPPAKANIMGSFGMPNRDIDGTVIFDYGKKTTAGKRLTDIDESRARAAFTELAKLYGVEEALTMVEAQPIILAFQFAVWKDSLNEWEQLFGAEKAQAMVVRNPGLLAVSPKDAATTTEQAIVFSYLVAYTRPFSKVLLPLLAFSLLTPAIEELTGITIRANLFGGL